MYIVSVHGRAFVDLRAVEIVRAGNINAASRDIAARAGV